MRSFVILGLTGPSGSGKSTFCKHLTDCGFALVDADAIAKQALMPGSSCVFQLKAVFGDDIADSDGVVNRSLLASRAFSSKQRTQALNDITHPWVFLRSLKLIKQLVENGERLIVFDAPVLFESNSDVMCDLIASVITDRETRLKRIMKRDNITQELANKRFDAQQSDSFYISKSDFVIDGAGDVEYLKNMALEIKHKSLSLKGGG
ncbi:MULTISPECIES: dephospho-CoA kinase [unclassified Ruminococcus]|uniref:dephospho-CoA kinase n=1 Tax=unclassified Ruminococcus TaxID=2608920 RepID=UPI00210C0082|nr:MULTISPECIES: dephospho-CoA kinase [unclassified Ruminococcus]MCQ4023162.1 dephospho-CoA kinase [Ruminococcus sp. zg-924]MCQ4115067.1 dephospho-CoA kinase [Ruminococcus sp. zg-921]